MAEAAEATGDAIILQSLSISPNNCPLGEPVDLQMEFDVSRPLPSARWVVKVSHWHSRILCDVILGPTGLTRLQFIADQADKRTIVVLGETPTTDYATGPQTMKFSV